MVADYHCRLASGYGIECAVVGSRGQYDFESAANALEAALPWLAAKIGTPGVPLVALSGAHS
jgi:hypothetical protein